MSYSIVRADSFTVVYDNAVRDRMPVARTRLQTFTSMGIDGYGIVITGQGGQEFNLVIERFLATYADCVTWSVDVGLLKKGLVAIATPRGTWAGCTIKSVGEVQIVAGIPNSVARVQLRGIVP